MIKSKPIIILSVLSFLVVGIFVFKDKLLVSEPPVVHLWLPLHKKPSQEFKAGFVIGNNSQATDLRIHDFKDGDELPVIKGEDKLKKHIVLSDVADVGTHFTKQGASNPVLISRDILGHWTQGGGDQSLIKMDSHLVDHLSRAISDNRVTLVKKKRQISVLEPLIKKQNKYKSLDFYGPVQFSFQLKKSKEQVGEVVILDVEKAELNPLLDQLRLSGREFKVIIVDPFGSFEKTDDLMLFKGVSFLTVYSEVSKDVFEVLDKEDFSYKNLNFLKGYVIGKSLAKNIQKN